MAWGMGVVSLEREAMGQGFTAHLQRLRILYLPATKLVMAVPAIMQVGVVPVEVFIASLVL
jgi:hypothetical protein